MPYAYGKSLKTRLSFYHLSQINRFVLQNPLEYWLTFQLPHGQAKNPLLISYKGILSLKRYLLLLTHFTLNHRSEKIYERYENLLDKLKRKLKVEKLQIIQANKGQVYF